MFISTNTKRLAAAVLAGALIFAGPALAGVGFQKFDIPDPQGGRIEVAVWYPADAPMRTIALGLNSMQAAPGAPIRGDALPVVVMSHGNGGFFGGHSDTAAALAEAGFVTAALTHSGDNYADQSRAADMANRPRQLSVLIDYLLKDWGLRERLDPQKVGAFGFSSGGFTVTAAIGGVPLMERVLEHCRRRPQFYDCQLIARAPADPARWRGWKRDERIKAAVIAEPALGYAFTAQSLSNIAIPVQLWRAELDQILPEPFYVQPVREQLGTPPEYHVAEKADHFDFLQPCSEEAIRHSPQICQSAPGFDRVAFHQRFNREVVRFFRERLGVVNRP